MDKPKTKQKETIIDNKNLFKSKYGTFDSNNPKVLYLKVKSKLKPIERKTNYSSDIKHIKATFSEYVENLLKENTTFSDKFISSIDISEKNIVFGRDSYVNYELLVRPLEAKQFDEYYDDMKHISETLNNELRNIIIENRFEIR